MSDEKLPHEVTVRDVRHRIKTAVRLATHLNEQGKDLDPTSRSATVEQKASVIDKLIEKKGAEGQALAQALEEKGSKVLDKKRAEIEKMLDDIERQLSLETQAIEALNNSYNFTTLIARQKEAREAKKKRTKVIKGALRPKG